LQVAFRVYLVKGRLCFTFNTYLYKPTGDTMKYNPITQELYTDAEVFLKKLHCPLAKRWEQLDPTSSAQAKTCSTCNQPVYDTLLLEDSKLQEILKNAPETCLKVDLNQQNLTITYAKHQ